MNFSFFKANRDFASVFIRLIVGFHLIYGVVDNVVSWERMLEFKKFLELHQFPLPLFCAVVSVYAQLICGLFYVIGFRVRYAALVMIFNFCVAIVFVHAGDSYPNMFPALMMLFGSLYLLFNGAGNLAIDKD